MGRGAEGGTVTAPARARRSWRESGAFKATIRFKMFPKTGMAEKEDGFTIAKALREDTNTEVVLKGKYGPVAEGQLIEIRRSEKRHDSRYGDYIQVWAISHEDPVSRAGVVNYLKNLPGVGDAIAEAIVDQLGADCLEQIDKDPSLLTTIKASGFGVKAEDLNEVERKWNELRAERKNLLYFSEIGIGDATGRKITKHFPGRDVREMIKEDPYCIAQVKGVGFKTADLIASKLGVAADDPRRAAAGVEYMLEQAEMDGHICLTREQILKRGAKLLKRNGKRPSDQVLEDGVERMVGEGRLFTEIDPGDGIERVYTAEHYLIETRLYGHIEDRLLSTPKELPAGMEHNGDMLVTEEQFTAVQHAFAHRISVLQGSAGTGKTTSMKEILDQADKHGYTYECLAPTGKAAKRMQETTGRPASTIHRALGFDNIVAPIIQESVDEPEPELDANIVIVDESSMLDMRVAERLLTYVDKDSHVVFVGDPHQLPAVGAGSVLHDLIESERPATTKLTQIFRQAEDSLLVVNANRIRKGQEPFWTQEEAERELGHSVREDWAFVEVPDPDNALARSITISEQLPEQMGILPEEVMVTAPSKKGGAGVHRLNSAIQRKRNPNGDVVREQKTDSQGEVYGEMRVEDMVMNTVNRYGARGKPDVMNGDQGTITAFNEEKKVVWVDFGLGEEVSFSGGEIDALIPAYAATTHKLQGSEAPAIVAPIAGGGGDRLLSRNLLYTAWTRGKEKCIAVGDKERIKQAISRDGSKRQTTLDLRVGRVMPRIKARYEKMGILFTSEPESEKDPSRLLYG